MNSYMKVKRLLLFYVLTAIGSSSMKVQVNIAILLNVILAKVTQVKIKEL